MDHEDRITGIPDGTASAGEDRLGLADTFAHLPPEWRDLLAQAAGRPSDQDLIAEVLQLHRQIATVRANTAVMDRQRLSRLARQAELMALMLLAGLRLRIARKVGAGT